MAQAPLLNFLELTAPEQPTRRGKALSRWFTDNGR